ncbi:peptidyl-prolyl cis-trans isomerase FKBP20-2 [Cucumis melo var. makuwa]|uniref:peptidylprolyl isomerase n=1 Tax=Cucumis melo var. makuwa TaxID=1194695 RepID=A0A5D3DB72_CUCMM|nr:peptidyl-prolyl cis-trans isomerase FKBP20-2 [Cucumis melo var. makuwa]
MPPMTFQALSGKVCIRLLFHGSIEVITPESYVKRDSGLIYWDIEVGNGDCPKDGQQVIFHYVGYNESGRRIDSTYLQGSPARIRVGTNALVPGFEEGIRGMRPGGKRRIIIPPELGPPNTRISIGENTPILEKNTLGWGRLESCPLKVKESRQALANKLN